MNVRLAAVASARAAGPRASGGRSHVLARLAAVVLALLVVANCKQAYADTDGFVMYSNTDGGAYNAVVRDVTNRYDAALICLGYQKTSVTDAEMEIKLSNEGSGGRFWEFAQTFYTDVDLDNIPSWSPTWLYGSIMSNGWIYGDNFARLLYWTETTQELYNGALQDLQTVLRGGSLGGGGSVSGQYVLVPKFVYNGTDSYVTDGTVSYGTDLKDYNVDTVASNKFPASNLTCSYPSDFFEHVPVNVDEYDLITGIHTWGTNSATLTSILVKPGGYEVVYGTYKDNYGKLGTVNAEYDYVESVRVTEGAYYVNGLPMSYTLSGTNIQLSYRGNEAPSNWITLSAGGSRNLSNSYQLVSVGETGGDGGGGTNNWPDPDPTPVPDPDPTEPVVPDPDPTPVPDPDPIDDPVLPDPDPIDNPSTGGGTTIVYAPPTDTTLIENWLSVIYDAITQGFNAVTTDMTTHCNHIQTKLTNLYEVMMSTLGKYLTNQTSSINNNLSNQTWWLARQIGNQFDGLMDYMHELTVWLAEQMDFSFTDTGYGYDDTSVVAWLKKIYAKLGTGGGTSKPTDPVEEPDNWWDWLLRALQNWVDGLGDVVGDLLGNLNELLGGLLDKFPFGIPWMTLEVITLLAADPVTPVFTVDYTVYTIPIHYEVDLSPYETAAATIRAMVYIVFGGFLLLKTPKVISEMMGVFE